MTDSAWPNVAFKLDIGDRVPNIFGPDQFGGNFSVNRSAPGPFAILSVPGPGKVGLEAASISFDGAVRAAKGTVANAVIAVVGPSEQVHQWARSQPIETPVLADTQGQLAALFRAGRDDQIESLPSRGGIIAIITDSDQTIRTVLPFTDADAYRTAVTSALEDVDTAGQRASGEGFAPVLRIPHLLSPEQCRALISTWQTSNHPGKIAGSGQYGESVNKIHEKRICYDHFIRQSDVLHRQIVSTIGPRIRYSAMRAFNFDIQHYEPFIIVGYPSSAGGFFGSHRDNIDPAHMHRRFALTVNLNTGEYEGGGVWFPEYADHIYDPPMGDGLVFSCSVLHEAKVVSEGTRMILSGFMWGPADEALRRRKAEQAEKGRQRETM